MHRKHSDKERKLRREGTPVKNRVYCPIACGMRLVFPTEEKAMRYIAYNASAIEEEAGYAPVRAYPCRACGGWHVTSKRRITRSSSTTTPKTQDEYGNK